MALALMSPVVSAVSYLHDQDPPVVHRDIKPSNIIVPTGGDEAVLVDFSIAKEYVPNSTTTAIRHGSPGYAAPEQYGTGTTPLTDVYGLGATLYTLLTGAIPTDALTRLTESKTDPLRPVKELVPAIPPEVSDVVKRAMNLNREDRFTDVEQFWQVFCEAADEKQASPAQITELSTSALPDIQLRPIEDITTAFTHKNGDIPVVRRGKVSLVLLTLLLIGLLTSGMLYFSFYYNRSTTPHPRVLPTIVARPMRSLSPTPFPTFSPYPQLASTYSGMSSILKAAPVNTPVNSPTQSLQLYNVQEVGNTINGLFQGLGQAGSFTGTITKYSEIDFRVTLYEGQATADFNGRIQLNGSMGGDYAVYNQNGQKTGERGEWNVVPIKQ
jgi:serine/threonine protein kinase